MGALAAYIMRGRMQAVLVTAVSAVLSALLAPLSMISGAAVGLVTLRIGPWQGASVAALAALASGALFFAVTGAALPALVFAGLVWVPVWGLAVVLRNTVDLARAAVVAGLLGALVVLVFHGLVADPAQWWREQIALFLQELQRAGGRADTAGLALDELSGLMTGALGAGLALGSLVSLLLARWWQALLYNPGGFREEFHRLRLGRAAGVVTLVLIAGAALADGTAGVVATDLAMVAMTLLLVQGLAVLHGIVGLTGAHVGWLIATYVLLVVAMPQMSLVLAVTGLTDNGFDFRAFFADKRA